MTIAAGTWSWAIEMRRVLGQRLTHKQGRTMKGGLSLHGAAMLMTIAARACSWTIEMRKVLV